MIEALLFVSNGSLIVASAATLATAAFTLRSVRRYVERAENRMEYLREEQTRLLAFLRKERRGLKEEPEREEQLEAERQAERRAERLSRECLQLQQKQGQLAGELEQERERREQERLALRDAEQRIEQLKRELREAQRESSPPVPEGLLESLETREIVEERTLPAHRAQGAGRIPQPAAFSEAAAPDPRGLPPGDKRPRLGLWHPHPDDDVGRERAPAGRVRSDAPVKMFRKHYDKYLENYQGYVELAERLYRMRDDGEVPPGSFEEREWEERLRRVNDGMERTTARLDILEEHNPDLATDDRISCRAGLAERHSELERRRLDRTTA